MKKSLSILTILTLLCTTSFAQQNKRAQLGKASAEIQGPAVNPHFSPEAGAPEGAVLWTEDFSNGFNSTNGQWTTGGINAAFVMADSDGPDNLLANGWGPLPSPTASDSFAIFDWYNRFPDPNGFATSPVAGTLISPVIDLTGNPIAEINFFQQIYWCCAVDWEALLEISTDGGASYPNSIVVNPVERNDRHWNEGFGYEFTYDLTSAIAADPSNVVLRFNWTSLTADVNGQYATAYFWMIDDIKLRVPPTHALEFTEFEVGVDANGDPVFAPANDIIFDGSQQWGRFGYIPLDQAAPITFDSNILNNGVAKQTNVKLNVEIIDNSNGASVQNLTSNPISIARGDTAHFDSVVTTGSWTPSAAGVYDIVYSVTSDSIPGGNDVRGVTNDTVTIHVTDQNTDDEIYSLEWDQVDNFVGTNSPVSTMLAMGVRYNMPNASSDTAGFELIEDLEILLSTLTDGTGILKVEVYDTTGFTLIGGFPNSPLFSRNYQITPTDTANGQRFLDMTSVVAGKGVPLALPNNAAYYVVLNMTANAANGVIRLANDATFQQPEFSSIFLSNESPPRWFTGFIGTNTFEAPYMRLHMAPARGVGIEENVLSKNELKIFPNPTDGKLNFDIKQGGDYQLMIFNTTGQLLVSQEINTNGNETVNRDFSVLPSGTYVVVLEGEESSKTATVTFK